MNMNTPSERERSAERQGGAQPLRTSDLAAAGAQTSQQSQEPDQGAQQPPGAQQPRRSETPRRSQDREALDRGEEQSMEADDRSRDDRRSDDSDPLDDDDRLDRNRSRAAPEREELEPLFSAMLANKYRSRWIAVQGSFVDDPRRAVQQGDQLVAEVMKNLAQTFADERAGLEDDLAQTGDASTEALRVTLRRYRSFFDRLLSL